MHRVLEKIKGMNEEKLSNFILEKYSKVCGDYGKKTFREKVLPIAHRTYKEPPLLVMKLFRVIQDAGNCKLSKIEEYLLDVVQRLNR